MKTVPVGQFMVTRGGSVNPSNFPDEEFELYSIPAHDRGGPEIVQGSKIGSSKQIVQPGDVMVSKIIPHIRRSRIVRPLEGRRQIASGEWIVFRSGSLNPNYLRQLLLSDLFHRQFMNTVAGVGGSLVRARPEQVKAIEIPIPPLGEQRRIAAILDQADALRVKRGQVLTHLGGLPHSVFEEMFARTSDYPVALLGDVAAVNSGITKGRRTNEPTRAVPYLAVANVQAGILKMDAVKEINATETEIARYALTSGDLVLTEGGDPDKLGRGTIWRDELPLCLHQNHIFRVRIRDRTQLAPDYLSALLRAREAREYFLRAAKQTTGIASINSTQLKALPIKIPSIRDQHEFISKLGHISAQAAMQQIAQTANDALFSAIQARAFRGEL